eukprot:TRINITY_DN25702_c0_g1_i1.p1 TRINITY_DN25702_c0_g1~~TRINITY_DN25702_c0_g1_i1.p1  ORF type:complete len:131 (-),score=27.86 TRINITY_DN25702_c0_g1_i1:324-716(-)
MASCASNRIMSKCWRRLTHREPGSTRCTRFRKGMLFWFLILAMLAGSAYLSLLAITTGGFTFIFSVIVFVALFAVFSVAHVVDLHKEGRDAVPAECCCDFYQGARCRIWSSVQVNQPRLDEALDGSQLEG